MAKDRCNRNLLQHKEKYSRKVCLISMRLSLFCSANILKDYKKTLNNIRSCYTQVLSLLNKLQKMDFNFKTLQEFNDYFKDEKTCYQMLENEYWGGVPVCPHCGTAKKPYTVKARGKFKDIPSYRCSERECDLPFTVRTKSIFEGSRVELRKWFQAIYELSTRKKGISSVELAERIGVSQKTGWLINHKLRDMLADTNPDILYGVVQLDETIVSGKNKNRHADKKIPHSQGRAAVKGRATVFGARGLHGNVRTQVVPNVEAATLVPIVKEWVKKGSIMVTDEWGAYNSLKKDFFHIQVNHSEGNYASGAFSSNGVENFWSILKRGIIGTFHSVSPQHLQRYCNEFETRYNQKDVSNIARFNYIVKNSRKDRIRYTELTSCTVEDCYINYNKPEDAKS